MIKEGDKVVCAVTGKKGKVVKRFFPLQMPQYTIIELENGRMYCAPTTNFFGVSQIGKEVEKQKQEVFMNSYIYKVEQNVRGAWVIYGALGVRQYYNYSKEEAVGKYKDECRHTLFTNQKKKSEGD